jgi:hypothetical protein
MPVPAPVAVQAAVLWVGRERTSIPAAVWRDLETWTDFMAPISFRDRKIFRMSHSKKMRWTVAALIATFLVLATDALGHPLNGQPPVTRSRRRRRKA